MTTSQKYIEISLFRLLRPKEPAKEFLLQVSKGLIAGFRTVLSSFTRNFNKYKC